MMKLRISLEQKHSLYGYLFILPSLIGVVLLFAIPIIQSFIFSLSTLTVESKGFVLEYVGLKNYYEAFFVDPQFRQMLTVSLLNMVTNVPLVIMFSFFAATVLNQKFKGRAAARAVFFLPVILASGVLLALDSWDLIQNGMRAGSMKEFQSTSSVLRSVELKSLLEMANVNRTLIAYFTGAVDRIYQIVSYSGVQMLIFLSGLQSIHPSLFEASHIEGATGWENFWKITFPMISPLILTNVVYSIISSFTDFNNQVITTIQETAFRMQNFGLSAAMAWVYFILISVILGVVMKLISKNVFYRN